MKSYVTLALAAAAAAMPTPQADTASTAPTKFGGLSIHSGSSIQYLSVNANGQSFWLNKPTATYCPEQVPCASNEFPDTVFAKGADTETLSLSVSVPGGQQVYVSEAGQLKFTQAHSASTGVGSTLAGFAIKDNGLTFEGQSWYACPDGDAYGIYAASKSTGTDCTGFKFRVIEDTETATGTWQYT